MVSAPHWTADSRVGEIYRYTLESGTRTVRELTEMQPWVVIPALKQVPGLAMSALFGGETTSSSSPRS